MIIKALNMYGRVPETWELLEEIDRLNNIINELEEQKDIIKSIYQSLCFSAPENYYIFIKQLGEVLKGSDKE